MTGWKRALWTIGLVFVVTCATAIVNAGGNVFDMDWTAWQTIINSAIAAVLAFVINYVAPFIPQYGIGKK